MGSKKSAAVAHQEDWELDDPGLSDQGCVDRTLVLRREPLPRKAQLISAGVKEIRCVSCVRIKPIAEAEECGEGWVCEDCLSDALEKWKHAGG